jgi:hypothetical protein
VAEEKKPITLILLWPYGHSFDVGDGLNLPIQKVITTTNMSTIPNIKPSCQEEVDAVPWASVSARPAGTVSTHTPKPASI